MGWSYGKNAEGREIGYAVEAKCDQKGCGKQIDRGLAYACGGMHDGGDHGCGGYFCYKHLFFGHCNSDDCNQLCKKCFLRRPIAKSGEEGGKN